MDGTDLQSLLSSCLERDCAAGVFIYIVFIFFLSFFFLQAVDLEFNYCGQFRVRFKRVGSTFRLPGWNLDFTTYYMCDLDLQKNKTSKKWDY